MATCRSCGADVIFTESAKGGAVAILDEQPVPDGNIILDQHGHAVYLTKAEKAIAPGPRYVSHFATCPQRARHRKAKR